MSPKPALSGTDTLNVFQTGKVGAPPISMYVPAPVQPLTNVP